MRLYKAVITDIPAEAKIHFTEVIKVSDDVWPEDLGYKTWDEDGLIIQDPDWKPAGWGDFLEDLAKSGTQWAVDLIEDGYTFVWPNLGDMFKSRSAAKNRARRAERWGATVTIMEAEVGPFIPVAEANARRKIARMRARASELQSKAGLLYSQAEVVAIKAGIDEFPS